MNGPAALRRALVCLAVIQVVLIVALALTTALRYPEFGIDEQAHVANVAWLDQHGSLAALGDQPPVALRQIFRRTYGPGAAGAPLSDEDYEAFQPPLYYLTALPAYALGHTMQGKIRVIRVYDALLFIAAVGLVLLLVRAAWRQDWLPAFCGANVVLLWPGVLTQSVTVSNAALELPVSLLFLLACVHATRRRSGPWLVAAGAAYALCLATSLNTIVLAPILLATAAGFLRQPGWRRSVPAAATALLVPVAVMAPWFVMNLNRYGDLDGERLIKLQQGYLIDPGHTHFGLSSVGQAAWHTTMAFEPQQWWSLFSASSTALLLKVLMLIVVATAMVAVITRAGPGNRGTTLLFAAPWFAGMVILAAGTLIGQWPILLPRYLNPEYVLLGALGALAVPQTRRSLVPYLTFGILAVLTLAITGLWVHYAHEFLRGFTANVIS